MDEPSTGLVIETAGGVVSGTVRVTVTDSVAELPEPSVQVTSTVSLPRTAEWLNRWPGCRSGPRPSCRWPCRSARRSCQWCSCRRRAKSR